MAIAVSGAVLVGIVTVAIMRYLERKFDTKKLHEEGIVLTETGIEFLGFFWFGRKKARYDEIESVELISFQRSFLSKLLLQYGISIRSIYTRISGQLVQVKLKGPRLFEYLLFTPSNPAAVVEQLKTKIVKNTS